MAIGNKYVNHENTVAVDIKAPAGVDEDGNYTWGKSTGVVFNMTSSKNPKAIVEAKRARDRLLAKRKGKGDQTITGEDVDAIEEATLRKVAACIASWSWGKEELRDGEGAPELTMDNAVEALRIDWIFAQVVEVPENLENFIVK